MCPLFGDYLIYSIYETETTVVSECTNVLYPGQTISLTLSSREGSDTIVASLTGDYRSIDFELAAKWMETLVNIASKSFV